MSNGVFGDDTQSTVVSSVACSGKEEEILNCSTSSTGVCSEHSAAVICQGAFPTL